MNERWVCKRCFADNEDIDAACTRCGLARGSEASADDQGAWAAQTGGTVATQPPAWRRWLRFWWIPILLIALAVGYFTSARRGDDGSLSTAGSVSIDDLRVGDCFDVGDETEITDVDGVPCTEPHEYEVFALDTYEADALPGDAELEAVFEDVCVEPFAAYVGIDYLDSELYGSMITPSEESWADGDRGFVCFLYDLDDPELTASMRGAGR